MIEMTVTTPRSQWTRYDLHIALIDGLFQPQKKIPQADLQRRRIDAYYDWRHDGQVHPKAIHLQLLAPYSLGVEAETVLLALLYLMEQNGEWRAPHPADPPILLQPHGDAQSKNIGILWSTRYSVLKTAGMGDSQSDYARLHHYLQLMSQIWIYYTNAVSGWEGNDGFLKYQVHKGTDRLLIQMNWRLAGALFGEYLNAYIDLRERHALRSNGAKTLHRWLSAHVWPGKTRTLHYETLLDHIWPDEATPGTRRVRLHRLKREILVDIQRLDRWRIQETPEAVGVKISRRKQDEVARA